MLERKVSRLDKNRPWLRRYLPWLNITESYLSIGKNLYKLDDSAKTPERNNPSMELPLAPYFGTDRAMVDSHEITVQKDAGATVTLEYGNIWTMSVGDGKTVKYQKVIGDEIRPTLKSSGATVVLDKLTLGISEVV